VKIYLNTSTNHAKTKINRRKKERRGNENKNKNKIKNRLGIQLAFNSFSSDKP
jgi:hypothetical protein